MNGATMWGIKKKIKKKSQNTRVKGNIERQCASTTGCELKRKKRAHRSVVSVQDSEYSTGESNLAKMALFISLAPFIGISFFFFYFPEESHFH